MQEFNNTIFNDLLSEAKKLPQIAHKKDTTFFDIMQYPHYENVISNILAFFLNPNEEHGLSDLWLKSLLECYPDEITTPTQTSFDIEREHTTDSGKRIDILLWSSDIVIVIENKIFANPNNPFKEYENYIVGKEDFKNHKQVFILLSLKKETTKSQFQNITYQKLIKTVNKNIKDYSNASNASQKWVFFHNDFIKNIQSLETNVKMDIAWQKYIKECNRDALRSFLEYYKKDIVEKTELLKHVQKKIEDPALFKSGIHNIPPRDHNYFSAFFELKGKNSSTLVIELYIKQVDPLFLHLALFKRGEKNSVLSEELNALKSTFPEICHQNGWSDWGNSLSIKTYNFAEISDMFIAIKDDVFQIINLLKIKEIVNPNL